ncbi:MAG TPA: DNA polymerase III subunit beta [Erysipelothrix sp.]|nr:DNA polymerase III subunit beta [Erysipelothrix sp.]
MNFTISKNAFYHGLSNVAKAIVVNSPLPQLSGIKIDVLENQIVLTASDSDLSIEHRLYLSDPNTKLNITEIGSVVIDARYLNDIVRKLEDDVIHVELIDGALVKIFDNLADFRINGMKASQYPKIDFSEPELSFTMKSEVLSNAINQTLFATSDRETRPVLTGVNFNYKAEDKKLVVIATDSYRLAHKTLSLENVDKDFNITIPRKALNELLRMIENHEEINISLDEKKIQFQFDHLLIQSRLLDGLFPETKRLIPTQFVTEIKTQMKQLVRAIDRASFIKSEGVSTVKFDIISDEIVITNTSQEMGSFKESISIDEFKGEPLKISFSSRFMIEALRSLNTLDVQIKFAGDMRPFLIINPNDESIIQLVLPVRSYD